MTGPGWRAVRRAAAATFCGHAILDLWAWHSWGRFALGNVLLWVDFPLSLSFVQLTGRKLLAASLILGGIQWAALGGALTYLLGRVVAGAGRGGEDVE